MKGEQINMNKLFTRIVRVFLGISMAAGVGVAIGAREKISEPVEAGTASVSFISSGYSYNSSVVTLSGHESSCSGSKWWGMYAGATLTTKTSYDIDPSADITVTLHARKYGTVTGGKEVMTFNVLNASTGDVIATTSIAPTTKSPTDGYEETIEAFSQDTSLSVKFQLESASNSGDGSLCGMTEASFTYTEGSGSGGGGGGGDTSFNVSYNGNGSSSGTLPAETTSYVSGSTCTVLGNTGSLTKSGKIFGGWNTAADGSGTSYKAGDSFNVTAATTLYARWITDYSESANLVIQGNYLNLPVQGTGNVSALTTATKLVATDKMEYMISPSSGFYAYKQTSNGDNSFDNSSNSKIFMGKRDAYFYNCDPLQKNIDKVELYSSAACSKSVNVAVGLGTSVMDKSYTTDAINLGTQNNIYTLYENQGSNNYKYFRVEVTNANNVSFQLRITYQKNSFSVTDSITNGSLSSTSSVISGSALNTSIVPTPGYDFPVSNAVTVTMGGVTLVSGTGYTYNTSTGAIAIASVTGNVVISATCPQIQTRAISTSLSNLTVKAGSATVLNVKTGATATVTFEVENSHYNLPASVTVTSSGTPLELTTDYTYNSTTGAVVLTYNEHYTGAIVITASGVRKSYKTITVNVENCTETTNIRTIDDGSSETLIFSASSGYDLPDSVTVSGTDSYVWTKADGSLVLNSSNAAITVTVSASLHVYTNPTSLENGKYYLNYINNGNHYFSGVTGSEDGKREGSYSSTIAGGAMVFTIQLVGDNQFSFRDNEGNYLGFTGTGSKDFYLGENAHYFSVNWLDETTGKRQIQSFEYNTRSIAWYADGSVFRTYANSNASGFVFERVESNISVDSSSANKNVLKGSTFDAEFAAAAGFTATLNYVDGGSKDITSIATWTLNTQVVNENATLTVTYSSQKQHSATVNGMNVYTTTVHHLSIDTSSAKTVYYLGASLDTSNLMITGLDEQESVVVDNVSVSKCTFSPTTLSTAGEQTITVSYVNDDESVATGTYSVDVVQTLNAINKPSSENYSKSFDSNLDKWPDYSSSQTWGEAVWSPSITWSSTAPDVPNVDATKGQQIGTASNPARIINLSTTSLDYDVTSVTVNASTAKDATANISVKVGGSAYGGNAKNLTTEAADYEFTGSATGKIEIIISQPSTSKGLYIKSISIAYNKTSNIANATGHEEAQKAVVKFAKAFNTAMDKTENCTTDLSTIWNQTTEGGVLYAWNQFKNDISGFVQSEKDWAYDLIKLVDGKWTDDTDENFEYCLERAMATYDVCISSKHNMTNFMLDDSSQALRSAPIDSINNGFLQFESSSLVAIIVIISMVSVTAIGGYLFLRRRKEQ